MAIGPDNIFHRDTHKRKTLFPLHVINHRGTSSFSAKVTQTITTSKELNDTNVKQEIDACHAPYTANIHALFHILQSVREYDLQWDLSIFFVCYRFDSRAAVCNFSVWCVSGVRLSKAIVERRCSDDCGFGVVYTCSLPVGKPIGSNDEMSIKQSLLILVYTSPQ